MNDFVAQYYGENRANLKRLSDTEVAALLLSPHASPVFTRLCQERFRRRQPPVEELAVLKNGCVVELPCCFREVEGEQPAFSFVNDLLEASL